MVDVKEVSAKDLGWQGPCYLIDDRNRMVLNVNMQWDYFSVNWDGHRKKFALDSLDWHVFPTVQEAEKYARKERILFHCSMSLLDGWELNQFIKNYRKEKGR